MQSLISKAVWQPHDGESDQEYNERIDEQKKMWRDLVRRNGTCFMMKFGPNDIRPVWEKDVKPEKLRQEIRSPAGTLLDCPLCQPYDVWSGLENVQENRRYLTRIINPRYREGNVEDGGVYAKCICIKSRRSYEAKR